LYFLFAAYIAPLGDSRDLTSHGQRTIFIDIGYDQEPGPLRCEPAAQRAPDSIGAACYYDDLVTYFHCYWILMCKLRVGIDCWPVSFSPVSDFILRAATLSHRSYETARPSWAQDAILRHEAVVPDAQVDVRCTS